MRYQTSSLQQPITKLLEIVYLARTKARGRTGELSAVGWMAGAWRVILPELVLRAWFEVEPAAPEAPKEPSTLFTVLVLRPPCTPEEVRTAYRRMAMQTHPDHNHEPDAAEQFMKVQRAYEVLSDPMKAKKYVAGLAIEKLMQAQEQDNARFDYAASPTGRRAWLSQLAASDPHGYRSPLRCGWILATGVQNPNWFVASAILAWTDITSASGATMVSSWVMGATEPEIEWV